MRPHQVPVLLDALFKLKKMGKTPPTPLIVAMDGAGKNGSIETYCQAGDLGLAVFTLGQAESAGDLAGTMGRRERLPCPVCVEADPDDPVRFREDHWLRHGNAEHGLDADGMRSRLEAHRALVVEVSEFQAPSTLPTSGEGVMVVDEYNRANGMVENLALELIGRHQLSINGWRLPPGWVMVALCNPPTDKFTGTNPMDAASESRVVILTLEPDANDFLDYARAKKLHPSVIRFVERNKTCLDSLKFKNPLLKNVEPRPRRLEMLADLAEVLPDDLLLECALGLLGPNFCDAYAEVLKEKEAPLTCEEVLGPYTKVQPRVKAMLATNRLDILEGTVSNLLAGLREAGKAPAKRQLANLSKFLCDVPAETLMRFTQACVDDKALTGATASPLRATYKELRDGFPDFVARLTQVLDDGADLLVPIPEAAAPVAAG